MCNVTPPPSPPQIIRHGIVCIRPTYVNIFSKKKHFGANMCFCNDTKSTKFYPIPSANVRKPNVLQIDSTKILVLLRMLGFFEENCLRNKPGLTQKKLAVSHDTFLDSISPRIKSRITISSFQRYCWSKNSGIWLDGRHWWPHPNKSDSPRCCLPTDSSQRCWWTERIL